MTQARDCPGLVLSEASPIALDAGVGTTTLDPAVAQAFMFVRLVTGSTHTLVAQRLQTFVAVAQQPLQHFVGMLAQMGRAHVFARGHARHAHG